MKYPSVELGVIEIMKRISSTEIKVGFKEIETLLCYAIRLDNSVKGQWRYLQCNQPLYRNIQSFKRKREGKQTDFKNHMKLVRRLKTKGLLSSDSSRPLELTDSAIFLLLNVYDAVDSHNLKSLLRNYPNNIIFNTFLYPFFTRETISSIIGTYHIGVLLKYLHDCCDEVAKYLWSVKRTKAYGSFLFNWHGLEKNRTQNINEPSFLQLKDFLKDMLSLKWVDNSEIMLTENGDKVRISNGLYSLQIRLSADRENADLIIKGQKKITLKVSCYSDLDGIKFPWSVYEPVKQDNGLQFLLDIIKSLIFTMITNMYDKALITDRAFVIEDMEILCKDKKFVRTINYFKTTLQSKMRQYMNLS